METCPHCETRVLPMQGQICPACQGDMSATPLLRKPSKSERDRKPRRSRTIVLAIVTVAAIVALGATGVSIAYTWIVLAVLLYLLAT